MSKLGDTVRGWLGVQNAVDSSQIIEGSNLWETFTGGVSSAGVAVTERSARRVSAVYASVNLIGGAVASLPLPVYERTADGRQRVDHPYSDLLNEQPDPAWSAAVFWEYLVSSLLLNGDSYARILRPSRMSPRATGFRPYHQRNVVVQRVAQRLAYRLTDPETNVVEVVDQDDMIHVPGPGFDGLTGESQIRNALRGAAGVALASDGYSAEFFANGARPDFALEYPTNLTQEQQDMVRSTWAGRHQGPSKSHLPALLSGGVRIQRLTMNAEDSQLIATRQFQVEDIARIFGVPAHMIGHTEKTTSWGSGVEQMSIGFVKYTLQRHLVKIEQELNRKLFGGTRYFVEFLTAGLERGDYKTRNEGYRIALGRAGEPAWMTINEVRKLENLPPLEGGDDLFTGEANEAAAQTAG